MESTTPVLTHSPIFVLNDLGTPTEFDRYGVDANIATTLDRDDDLTLANQTGGTVHRIVFFKPPATEDSAFG